MKRLEEYQKRLAAGERAADIMDDMEREFLIPAIDNADYNRANPDVIELYREVANSREYADMGTHCEECEFYNDCDQTQEVRYGKEDGQ